MLVDETAADTTCSLAVQIPSVGRVTADDAGSPAVEHGGAGCGIVSEKTAGISFGASDIHVKGRAGFYEAGMNTAGQTAYRAVFIGIGHAGVSIGIGDITVHVYIVHMGHFAGITAEAAKNTGWLGIAVVDRGVGECKVMHIAV